MGSGSPNKKDRPVIRSPRKGSGGGGGNGGGREFDPTTYCIAYFDTKLKENPLLKRGSPLAINEKGEIRSGIHVVGSLSMSEHKRVGRCSEEGYGYRGKVMEGKDHRFYARFERYTL